MAILDSVNSLKDSIRNPFQKDLKNPAYENDFPNGFVISEILSNGDIGDVVPLIGNMLPKIPFSFGGGQRVKKDFYAGYGEPVVQVLGGEEEDISINGRFKDKRYKNDSLKGASHEFQLLIDAIRKRGNIVKIELGEFHRYGIISKVKFDMNRLSEIDYNITFLIIGEKMPSNARFLEETKEAPLAINKKLIEDALAFQLSYDTIPDSVPRSIGETLNDLTSQVASAVNVVTSFVDQIITTVNDVQKSVARAKGLIKYTQNKLKNYKSFVGSIQPFSDQQALTGKYTASKFYSAQIASASDMTRTLERLKLQLSTLAPSVPLGRHFIVNGDNLQKIAIKFYGSPDNWKKIYDYNKLTSTQLQVGKILEIPR